MKLLSHFFFFAALALSFMPEAKGQSSTSSQQVDFTPFEYRNIGPTRGGRATTVCGVTSNPSTFYMGATGGGVWKSTDSGISWNNISDGFFATPSIGDIQVYQQDPNIIYVGTGSDGLRSNVIAGKGMYKSTDAGVTWKHIGLKNVGQIGAVEIHPENKDLVFVAAIGQGFNSNPERGLYRTKDGGSTWEQVLFISNTIGIVDFEFHPTNPEIMYAAAWKVERKPWTIVSGGFQEGGIYKSTDGGDTWSLLSGGLPTGIVGKIDLAVSAASPDKLIALVEAETGQEGVYVSMDQGQTFEVVSRKKQLLDRPFYYCNIEADPNDSNIMYSMATGYWKSTDGGKTWVRKRTPHGDNHDLWINPENSNLQIQANDGGVNVTFNGGESWTSQLNQSTAELYQVEVDNQHPYWLYAGQQDNYTTIAVPSLPPGVSRGYSQAGLLGLVMNTGGCETGPAVPHPDNPNIVYSNCKGRFGVFNKLTGQEKRYYVGASNMYGHNPKDLKFRFQRVSPIHISPHDSDVVYHCSQFVHVTRDEGKTWETISPDLTAFQSDKQVISGSPITRDITGEEFYSTIYSIQESKIQKGLIWVGANDGPVHVTQDGGKNWKHVTPADLPPGGRVDSVEPSPHSPGKAYVSNLRYQFGDWKPYIFKTVDYGKSWTLITSGLPDDYPVRVVREDPTKEGILYAGTEFGMFISLDDGANWSPFQQNLPVTPITDIKVHQNDLVMSTMGRGFWILDNLTPLYDQYASTQSLKLFDIKNTFRYRHRGNSQTSIPRYPSAGVTIDYYVPKGHEETVQLEIYDDSGNLVRAFHSEVDKKEDSTSPSMETGFLQPNSSPSLKKEPGLNRFRWNMRHYGFWDKDAKKDGNRGPLVQPGDYIARLVSGNNKMQQPFKIKADPTITKAGVSVEDLGTQEALSLQVRDLRNAVSKYGEDIKTKLEEDKENKKLQEINSALYTAEGRYMTPKLIDQIGYLYSMLDQADQLPGRDAYIRLEELKEWFSKVKGMKEDGTD